MNHSAINLNTPLTMKGITIKNRVAKGALSEGMATLGKGKQPDPNLSLITVLVPYSPQNIRKVVQGRIRVRA